MHYSSMGENNAALYRQWFANWSLTVFIVTPDSKNTSTIVIPESDSDDDNDDFKPTSKYRTPGGTAQVGYQSCR